MGTRLVLTPLIHVELANIGVSERFYALVDSGADYSYLPYECAVVLGLNPEALEGPVLRNQGLGGVVPAKFVVLRMTVLDHNAGIPLELEMPFQVPVKEGPDTKLVLIGRHPFFEWFDVDFRMGFTDDPSLGKWVIREVTGKRDSRRYKG